MSEKVLVTFATMSGSTRDVAEVIGEELQNAGFDTDIKKVTEVKDISHYTSIIAGTTVMMGMLNSQGTKFLKRFKRELESKKVSYFLMCGALGDPNEKNRKAAKSYMQKMLGITPEVTPLDTATFAGGLKGEGQDLQEANFFFKWIIPKILKEVKDYRDFDIIRSWSKKLAKKLGA